MISGLNHITLTVSQLDISLEFYTKILGFVPEVKWKKGAYLSANGIWLCLSVGSPCPSSDYSHIAFSVTQSQLTDLRELIKVHQVTVWQPNTSEGDSIYLLDPDGHKLELHVGDLQTRLSALKTQPYEGLEWLNANDSK